MGNTLFIVWRESIEAMLVIGILYAWLKRREAANIGVQGAVSIPPGMRYLWGGVAAGIGLALALATGMLTVQSQLTGEALEYFQIGLVLTAAGLITHMVFWMRRHGRTMKRELESGMEKAAERANWWGMVAVVAIAVGREGAETVIFLYGLGLEQSGGTLVNFAAAAAAGFGLALLSFWVLTKGSKILSWRAFFRFSEVVLLLLAASLLVGGMEKLIGLGVLPAIVEPLWDVSAVLDDTGSVGAVIAALTGYRAQPSLTVAAMYAAYWGLVWAAMRAMRAPAKAA
jgi:high-affinity iron transporter